MIGHDFPYLDTRDLNLDWLLKNMKQVLADWATYQQTMNQNFADLQAAVNQFETDITTAFDNLHDYVEDYFDNLDVQQEINNKLDDMKRSGELAQIMNPLIASETATWLSAHITNPSSPPVDTSLSVSGAAADAKVTGDNITTLKNTIQQSVENGQDTFFACGIFQPGGLEEDGSLKPQQKWRMSNTDPMTFYRDITVKVKNGFRWGYIPFVNGSAGSWKGWYTTDTTIPAGTSFIVQIARVNEDISETATALEFVGSLTFDDIGIVNTNRIDTVGMNLFNNISSGEIKWDYTSNFGEHIEEYSFVSGNIYVFDNKTNWGTGAIYLYRKDGTYITLTNSIAKDETFSFIPFENFYKFRVYVNSTGGGGEFILYDYGVVERIKQAESISKGIGFNIVQMLSWEQGSINSAGNPTTNLTIIRSRFHNIEGIEKLVLQTTAYKIGWHLYDNQFNHIASAPAFVTANADLLIGNACYIRFNIQKNDASDFAPADFDPTGMSINVGYLADRTFVNGQSAVSEYLGKIDIKNKFRHTTFIPALKGLFTPTASLPTRRQQGSAVYNNIMFNLFDKGGLSILNIAERSVINEYTVDVASPDNHMNNAGFSNIFYGNNNTYPLMYISECYGNHRCFVENVTNESAELIQTITFSNGNGDYSTAFDWIIDTFTGELMTYGIMANGKHKIKVFEIPGVETTTVTLNESDVLDQWVIEDYFRSGFAYTYQGSCAFSSMIYLVCYNPNKIICVNAQTHQVTAEVPLSFISGEPEGIGICDGVMYLTTWNNADTTIYTIQF